MIRRNVCMALANLMEQRSCCSPLQWKTGYADFDRPGWKDQFPERRASFQRREIAYRHSGEPLISHVRLETEARFDGPQIVYLYLLATGEDSRTCVCSGIRCQRVNG